ncbi:MAG: sensor histidine kinase, partial [Chloroflexota bacterium]
MTTQPPEPLLDATARALIESAPDAVVTVDSDGLIVLVNDQTERLFGYTRSELLGSPVELLLPVRYHTGHVSHRLAYMGEPRRRPMGANLDLMARRRDGSEFPVEISLSPVDTEGNRLIISTIRDVSERRRTEQELRQWAEYFQRSGQGLAIISDGYRRAVNSAYARMHGYSVEELIGSASGSLTPPEYADELAEHIQLAVSEGHHTFETVHLRKDGSTFPIMMDVTAIKDAQGTLLYRIVHAQDITDRVRTAEDLRRTVEELARSNADLQQFAYVASHDLQEPLRMVASYTQLLARRYKGKLDAEADEFIAFAVEGATRMQGLINDLLAYSRVGTRGAEARPTDASEVLRQVLHDLSPAIQESGAEITQDELPTLNIDPTQLRQLLQNLISNAIKFQGPEQPRISIGVSENAHEWRFMVQDNGLGIDPRHMDRIFVIFQRLHTREEYPGTGIGLAICKKIVERHGGRIWVESTPGHGATFFFT